MPYASTLIRSAIVLAIFLMGSTLLADGPGDIMAQLMARFDAWDTNKDGFVDKEELTKALGEARANRVLQLYDKDKDGKLSKEEYTAWAKAYVAELKARQGGDRPREGAPRPRG